jgi:hypothetical protein
MKKSARSKPIVISSHYKQFFVCGGRIASTLEFFFLSIFLPEFRMAMAGRIFLGPGRLQCACTFSVIISTTMTFIHSRLLLLFSAQESPSDL